MWSILRVMPRTSTPALPEAQTVTKVAPSALNTFHKNARRGDVDSIAASLKVRDQYKPIVVNRGTFTGRPAEVLAGNHTLKAIRQLGEKYPDDDRWNTVLCWWVDVDEDTANEIVVADNRTADKGGYDAAELADLIGSINPDRLESVGYSADEAAALIDAVNKDPDPAPDPDPNDGLPGGAVIQYNLIFDDEGQQQEWFDFLKWLKRTYFDGSTIAERLATYLRDTAGDRE
ncbi:ParB-like nuclease domain protein [Mycobacterium phage Abinghost]|nr:ParB-like nuclease domain protein [Mycobacterium phage Chandler]QGH76041.1 ParB-like nuclease domain protein [Mycobacterium phage Abinghost]UDG78860.1 ParB-like nuclease domain protein [Mycobacterium phage LestyG]